MVRFFASWSHCRTVMKRITFLSYVIFVELAGVSNVGMVHAEDRIVCETVSTRSSIVQRGTTHTLRIVLQNLTRKAVTIDEFHFGANLLDIRAVAKADGHRLTTSIPLLSPGTKPMLIRSGGSVVRDVDLDGSLPELARTLRGSDVDVSWTLGLEPSDECFSQEVKTTFTLHQGGS